LSELHQCSPSDYFVKKQWQQTAFASTGRPSHNKKLDAAADRAGNGCPYLCNESSNLYYRIFLPNPIFSFPLSQR
jgi:hypothetical protein